MLGKESSKIYKDLRETTREIKASARSMRRICQIDLRMSPPMTLSAPTIEKRLTQILLLLNHIREGTLNNIVFQLLLLQQVHKHQNNNSFCSSEAIPGNVEMVFGMQKPTQLIVQAPISEGQKYFFSSSKVKINNRTLH